jgi:hypothetical protein
LHYTTLAGLAVPIPSANPKGFLKMMLVPIKLFWLKLCHLESEFAKPLGFLILLLNSYI